MTNEIKLVIGSWGLYNACNNRALGSEWLCLNTYSDWNQIAAALKKQGFRLDGIDIELFVHDIDGLPSNCENWDYINPKELFETLKESGVLNSEYLYTILCAYLEVRSFQEFAERVANLETTGTTISTSMKTTTGKITAENCLKTATGIWTTSLSTTSTLRSTEDRPD